jgi:translation initiation factor 3 subunit L
MAQWQVRVDIDRFFSEEGIPAFEELFLYACPRFITANPPPYNDPNALSALVEEPPIEPAQRHLASFMSNVRAQAPLPTLRSFLRLYSSLDAEKLANFLDADEEQMVQQLMVMKQASRSISRVGNEKGLLEGQTIATGDLSFVIDEVRFIYCYSLCYLLIEHRWNKNMVHIAESTVGRRYAGWFINNTERAQRIFDDLRKSPLPVGPKVPLQTTAPELQTKTAKPKVTWGGVKVS